LAGVYLNFSEDNLKWLPALLRAPAEIFFGVYNNSVELFVSSERIHTSGLGPFWTLAVEMQFYIFWPLILLLCKNDNIRAIVSLFLGCLFLLMVRPIANEFWGAKYYLIHNNLSELFLGSFLAFLYDGSASAMTPQTSKLISIILAILIWFYPNSINNTFFSGTVVSLSSVFIVGLAVFARESFDIPLLGKIFGFLGRRSFSFYAVQLVLANIVVWYVNSIYFSQKSLSEYEFYFYQFIIFIIMLFTVSELVYRFIEKPSREFGRR
jgi:peptidoglycan/LPS O-acetylase OafA/YrhL